MGTNTQLGSKVYDSVTNLTGMAYARLTRMNGSIQIFIQPSGDGKSIPEGTYIDEYTVCTSSAVGVDNYPKPVQTNIAFGHKVREIASKQVGIVTSRVDYLNGCVQFEVTPESIDNKSPEAFWVDQSRLEIISSYGLPECRCQQTDTGGPMHHGSFKAR